MKKIIYITLVFLFIACNSDNESGCFNRAGTIVQREIEQVPFSKIVVFERVQLFLKQGPIQKIIVESGENLIDNVEVMVANDRLTLIDNNKCNFVRDYDKTKVYVTSPHITEIRNSSSLEVSSIGILAFPKLALFVENYENEDVYRVDGDFNLTVNVEELIIVSNGFSSFRLKGNANKAHFGLFAGNSRILAEDLLINDLTLFHRSTNKMVVNPIESIKGEIVSLGDVIAKNKPPIVVVEELFEGKLIFE